MYKTMHYDAVHDFASVFILLPNISLANILSQVRMSSRSSLAVKANFLTDFWNFSYPDYFFTIGRHFYTAIQGALYAHIKSLVLQFESSGLHIVHMSFVRDTNPILLISLFPIFSLFLDFGTVSSTHPDTPS